MSATWLFQSNETNNLLTEVLAFEQSWQNEFELADINEELLRLEQALIQGVNQTLDKQKLLYQAIDYLIDDLGFTGPGLQMLPESSLSNVSFCIMHKTGDEITLSVIFCHLLKSLGFEALISELPEGIALAVRLSSSEIVLIDALSGATEYLISNDDVKSSLVSDIAQYAKAIQHEDLVKLILTEQKLALLDEGLFEQALACVEVLMELLPEDPYERRDRGLVLNQLDCGQWAKDDFDYFIKACPNDPMAMFIRLQLEEQSPIVATIH
ncbi:MAG: tetratricopeptide repeat protein [Gammaproteobacteria bacterium]|nr:tetratricopeptide repeat protein [Gammaproteobacteria bacterium]